MSEYKYFKLEALIKKLNETRANVGGEIKLISIHADALKDLLLDADLYSYIGFSRSVVVTSKTIEDIIGCEISTYGEIMTNKDHSKLVIIINKRITIEEEI